MKKEEQNSKKKELWKWIKSFRKAYDNSMCLFPGCDSKSGVNCHSISKTKHLSVIAKDGHVQWTRLFPDKIITGRAKPFLEGINKVSIFKGLCSQHDGTIFKCIDEEDFQCSNEQLFFLSYRIFLAQLWFNMTDVISYSKGLSNEQLEQIPPMNYIPEYVSNKREELDFHLWSITIWKKEFERVYKEKDYDCFRSYVIEFENTPTILTTIPFFRPFDLNGIYFNVPIEDHPARPFIYVSILPHSKKGGYASFTWHRDSNKYSEIFMDSLNAKSNEEITDILLKIFFVYYGNLVICPTWWENLEGDKKEYLEILLAMGVTGQYEKGRKSIKDGMLIDDWNVITKGYVN